MIGPLNNTGLIPRSFDVIFNFIGTHLGKKYVRWIVCPLSLTSRVLKLFRSDLQNGYDVQTESDILLDRQRRELSKNNPRRAAEQTLDTTSTVESAWRIEKPHRRHLNRDRSMFEERCRKISFDLVSTASLSTTFSREESI
jgi:hypothetical protein